MRLGFAVPVCGPWATPQHQVEVARRAEHLGYHALWTFQRLLYPVDDANPRWNPSYREVADPVVTLAYLAGATTRIRLGVAVLNLPWFSPVLLAKQAAGLDIVSGGRLDLGLGLGWAREEYAAAGVPFAGRGARAEEFVRCLHALWGEPPVSFTGDLWQVPPSFVAPRPVQRPGPPLLLGGFARPALERAGRLADGWVSSARADLGALGESVRTVREAAERAGRDPDRLSFVCRGVVRLGARTGGSDAPPLTGSPDQVRRAVDDLAAQGITDTFVDLNFDPQVGGPDVPPERAMERAHEALDALAPAR